MRLYLVKGDVIKGRIKTQRAFQFYPTMKECFTAIRNYQVICMGELANVTYEAVDVPTDKAGLLAWLNEYTIGTPEEVANDQG